MSREQRRGARLTLRQFFQEIFSPDFLLDRALKTHRAYFEALAHWERITDDPPLKRIDGRLLTGFKRSLSKGGPEARPLSAATVNKHLRHLAALLNKAGPPGPGNRDALGLIRTVPWTRPLELDRRLPPDIDGDTLDAIYIAAKTAKFPELFGVQPVYWWRGLMQTAIMTAYRKSALLSLRWVNIDWQQQTIGLPAEADKCHTERRKPVLPGLLKYLQRIRTSQPLIFPWPHAPRTWYRQWHRNQDAAGLPRTEHITWHNLKAASGSRYSRGGASISALQQHLDHASITTSRHYVRVASPEQREAIERMPLPAEMARDLQ